MLRKWRYSFSLFPDGTAAVSVKLLTEKKSFCWCVNRLKPDPKNFKVPLAGLPVPAVGFGSGSTGYSKALKRKLFPLVMPSWQQFPQRAQLTAYFDRSPGNSMYSIRKPDDRRRWILPFDTFPVEMCWFPSLNVFGSISCRIGGLYRDKQPLSLYTKGAPAWWPCWALLRNTVDDASGTKAAWW